MSAISPISCSKKHSSVVVADETPSVGVVGTLSPYTANISWVNTAGLVLHSDALDPVGWASSPTTITGLLPNTLYKMYMRFTNSSSVSHDSDLFSFRTLPGPPTHVAASSIGVYSIGVSWDVVPGLTYQVFVGGALALDNVSSGCVLNNLAGNTLYRIVVKASNSSGTTVSSELVVTTLPTAGAPAITNSTTTSFSPTWTMESGVTYQIKKDGVIVSGGTYSGFVVSGLSQNTGYTIVVTATSVQGTSDSTPVVGYTKADAPTGLYVGTMGTTTAVLSWAVVSGLSYRVYLGGSTLLGTYTSGSVVTGIPANYSSTLSVAAVNGGGESAKSITVNIITLPTPPTGLYASSITHNSLNLNWGPAAEPGVYYSVYLNGAGVSSTGASGTQITGLSVYTQCSLFVRATNATGYVDSATYLVTTTKQQLRVDVLGGPVPSTGTTLANALLTTYGWTGSHVDLNLHLSGAWYMSTNGSSSSTLTIQFSLSTQSTVSITVDSGCHIVGSGGASSTTGNNNASQNSAGLQIWGGNTPIKLYNYGYIVGGGGGGGKGGSSSGSPNPSAGENGGQGGVGLISLQGNLTVYNYYVISGGGGGGGGGGGSGSTLSYSGSSGAGFTADGTNGQGAPGGNGSIGSPSGGTGGPGGSSGNPGRAGTNGLGGWTGGLGGAAGPAIVGNSGITWANVGTIIGTIG